LAKTALILGVSGQDGAYLSRLLLDKRYVVHGTSRNAARHDFSRLRALGVRDRVVTHSVSTTDARALRPLLAHVRPDEIYNFAGISSVSHSFADPVATWTSVAEAHLALLESVRAAAPAARLYHSASSECFGDIDAGSAADERTPFAPRSPYGRAKAAAHRATVEYRERYGLHASSGIVFNHESPLRDERFVTMKIVSAAAGIAAGSGEKLLLGDVSVSRDWGCAAESVEAMWTMLQRDQPGDYVIATGESHTVDDLAAAAFAEFGLDHREHVVVDRSLIRSAEVRYSRGNPSRAREVLGWKARTTFNGLVRMLCEAVRVPATAV
jgi:GDPmannose 4,6-dehydratase